MNPSGEKNRVDLIDISILLLELEKQIKILIHKIDVIQGNNEPNNIQKDDRELLTTMEVASMLKVARITVYRMVKRGDIQSYRNGKTLLFYKDEITKWLESNRTNDHLVAIPTLDGYLNSRIK